MKLRHLLITASLLTGLSAMAQTVPTTDTAATPSGARQTGPMQKMRGLMGHRQTQHLEALKVSLKLQPEQESQWTAFAGNMKAHSPERQHFVIADMDKLTTPERIDKMTAWKAQHDAEMQKHGDATKTFYATLSDEQKKTFDQHTGKFMRRMAEGHHGGPGYLHKF
jgi:hypothetical protein